MITGKDVTVESVSKELEELEVNYRSMKRKLKALLAVLKEEKKEEGEANG